MSRLSRRSVLAGAAAMLGGAAVPRASLAQQGASLAALAAQSGRFFGSALASSALSEAGSYLTVLEQECAVWVPEWEVKWGALSAQLDDAPNFGPVDAIVDKAVSLGKRLRGHTLVWYAHLPENIDTLTSSTDWDRYVAPHVFEVASRYRHAMFQWDVVNEAIQPSDRNADDLRSSPFLTMLGGDYIAEAFRIAHAAAPEAHLYLNEYDLTYDEPWQAEKRHAVLRLLEKLLGQGVPVHGIGIQSHLNLTYRFSESIYRRFLAELEAMGLDIVLTELDVREQHETAGLDITTRQTRAADEVRGPLSVALDNTAVAGIVTWGLSDQDSWLRKGLGVPQNQGLPYDDMLSPTPMRKTLANLFLNARTYHG